MNRESLLENWLKQILQLRPYHCKLLAGDASLRRYYRIQCEGESYIAMDAPPPESPKLFTQIAALLEMQGLTVPQIKACDFMRGFLLLSDFGDRLYLHELNEHSASALYEDAFKALIQMQHCKAPLPSFDKAFARQQIEVLFKGWYLKTHLNIEDSAAMLDINPALEQIMAVLYEQPQVFMHRDYHSRNLMILDPANTGIKNPGILDFQDALIGPITYDLVSLLQDCYIAWPRSQVEDWVADFQERLELASHLPKHIKKSTFLRWFDFTGLQRHLKNLGIFARKYHRDQNAEYLKDIPMPLHYIVDAFARYPELEPLAYLFETLEISEKTIAAGQTA